MSQSICSLDSSENSNIQSQLQMSKSNQTSRQIVSPKNNTKSSSVSFKAPIDSLGQIQTILLASQLEGEVSAMQSDMGLGGEEAKEEIFGCFEQIVDIGVHIARSFQQTSAEQDRLIRMENMSLMLTAQKIRFGLKKSIKSKKIFNSWRQCLQLFHHIINISLKGFQRLQNGSNWSEIIKQQKTVKVELSAKEITNFLNSTIRNLAKKAADDIYIDCRQNPNFKENKLDECGIVLLEIKKVLVRLQKIMLTGPNPEKTARLQDIRILLSAERVKYRLIRLSNSKELLATWRVSLMLLREIIQLIASDYSKVPTKPQKQPGDKAPVSSNQ